MRSRIAAAAGVSTGNLSKARHLIADAHPQVLEALRSGEISIHRASLWLATLDKQLEHFRLYQNRRGIIRTISVLQRRHRFTAGDEPLDLQRIAGALAAVSPTQSENIFVAEIKVPGNVLLLSPALRQTLTRRGGFLA